MTDMSGLEIIFADPTGRANEADRTRIRSRVMRGKNKREDSRRSLREARRSAVGDVRVVAATHVPPPLSGDLALVQLAEDIDSRSQEMLFKSKLLAAVHRAQRLKPPVFACKTLNQSLSPLDRCVSFPAVETHCFNWLFHDAAFLHCLLLLSCMLHDCALGTQLRPRTKAYFHLRQTIAELNRKLGQRDAYTKDSTLYVVEALTMLAAMTGDWRSASAHIAGLSRIVELRGGWRYLRQRPKLHFKLDR